MQKTVKHFSVLIPDGESHILIYVINCLSQISGIKIYVMSNKKHSAMRFSRHVHNFSYYPKTLIETEWIANLNKELEKFDIDVVMPIFENGIRTIIKHKNLIEPSTKLGLLPTIENFNTAINKGLLSKLLVRDHIPGPISVIIEPNKTFALDSIEFPALVKPLEGFGGGKGIQVFNTKRELLDFFETNNFTYPYLVQNYIKGYDIDCSVLCKEGNILAYTIQKGNLVGTSEFAPQIGLQFLFEQNLFEVAKKLMKSLNWSGVAHIDMRYDEKDNLFKVIEVNTRFWVSLDASLIAGVNFPYLYCLASLDAPFQTPQYEFIHYLNLKGIIKRIKLNIGFVKETRFILTNTPLKFALKDPIPMIFKFINRSKNVILNKEN